MKKNRTGTWFPLKKSRVKLLMVMKLIVLMVCGFVFSLSASVRAQDQTVTLKAEGMPFLKVISELKRQTRLDFFYSFNEVETDRVVSIDVKDVKIDEVLKQILGKGFTWEYINDMVIIKPVLSKAPEKKSVRLKGFVHDAKKQPLPGVTVKIVGLSLGTATDAKGWFALDLPLQKGALEFSFVGFKKQVVAFTEKTDTLRVTLEEDVSDLDEVVVRAFGTQNKREVISSISRVTAEEMKELPAASFISMLQGRVPGMNIVNQSGAPGSQAVVTIRGFNSFIDGTGNSNGASDGQPLYVVDGMPMHSFVSPVTGTNTLADLDPSMVESVEILKDAAAASIYGSRAGNGVILITTKKGREGEAKFAANVSYTVSKVLEYPTQTGGRMERWLNVLYERKSTSPFGTWINGTQYANIEPISYESVWGTSGVYDNFWNNGTTNNISTDRPIQDSLNPFYNNSTNWWKYALRTGKVMNFNLQASGGTARIQYMVGLGYYKETGIMINSAYARANFIANLQAKVRKDMTLDTRVYASYVDRSTSGSMIKNRYEGLSVDPCNESTLKGATEEVQAVWLETVNGTVRRSDDYRGMFNVLWKWEPLKGLSLSASGRVDYSQGNLNTFTPSTLDAQYHENKSQGQIGRNISLSTEELLNYHTSIKDVHNLDVLIGLNVTKDQKFTIGGYGKGGASDYVYWYDPTKNPATVERPTYNGTRVESLTSYGSSFTERSMVSYFGRVGYNYKQRYLIEATIRRDGSSTFGEDNKWADFPSVAVGWAFSEEWFMKKLAWLNWGKIRFSYGTSGQIFTDEYLAHGLMTQDGQVIFQGSPGVVPDKAISPDLKWEKTKQYDIGLDLDLFNYRVNFKLDYYYKYTDQLIQNVGLPATIHNFNSRIENAMAISNEGLEFEILYNVIRDRALTWRTKLNVSRNWNRFEKSYNSKDFGDQFVIGRPMYQIMAYKDEGFYDTEAEVPTYYNWAGLKVYLNGRVAQAGYISGLVGTQKLADLDGDNDISIVDMYPAASAVTVAHGGWVNELKWKGFEMNLLFNYAIGRHMINAKRYAFASNPTKYIDYRKLRVWQQAGDKAEFPAMGKYAHTALDSYIERVNSISLKQITFGYDLPRKIAGKCGFSGIRVFMTGENIFYLSNYSGENPEVIDVYSGIDDGRSYPLPQKWTFGLTLNF